MSWSALGWAVLREKVKAKGLLRSAASYRSKGERESGGVQLWWHMEKGGPAIACSNGAGGWWLASARHGGGG
jgi:hypothetical protein